MRHHDAFGRRQAATFNDAAAMKITDGTTVTTADSLVTSSAVAGTVAL